MITLEFKSKRQIIEVTGNPVDLAVYYCIWQTKLWPTWCDYEKLGDEHDSAARQFTDAIDEINSRAALVISALPECHRASDAAVERCRKLGIEVDDKSHDD